MSQLTAAVEVRNVSKFFGSVTALREISFDVPTGALCGIIGADGAGKTTCLRILATLLAPDSGSVRILGLDTVNRYLELRSMLGYMPQRFSLYEDLSVAENISFFSDLFGLSGIERHRRIERLLSFTRLDSCVNRRARYLSGGMKQKLALCCALVNTPPVLLLDEPTTGVDPVSRSEFWELLHEINQRGTTIVVSTPYMSETDHCSQVLLVHRGTLLLSGVPRDLLASYPLVLRRVSSSRGTLHVPHTQSLLPCGGRMYPVRGALHVAFSPQSVPDNETILSQIRVVVPLADHIEPLSPTFEDILFHTLGTFIEEPCRERD